MFYLKYNLLKIKVVFELYQNKIIIYYYPDIVRYSFSFTVQYDDTLNI